MTELNRREFTAATVTAAVAATSAKSYSRIPGSNNRVRIGVIGVGNRGLQVVDAFSKHEDCEFVAAADVYESYLSRAKSKINPDLKLYEDYRKMLDRSELDATIVATPDHWHALQTIHSIQAGMDVYVEKPASNTIVEGQRMVEAAQKHKKIVQVGLQRRSMAVYHSLNEYLQTGKLGKITVSQSFRITNMAPDGIGREKPEEPSSGLNWDQWLGPRPEQSFQRNIAPYKFRWWLGYSSQMGNWGVHYFDLIRWMLNVSAPKSVVCVGGRYAVDDDRTIPDTAQAIFEMPDDSLMLFGQYEANSQPAIPWGEVEFRGTLGSAYAAGSGYQIKTEKPGQFQVAGKRADPFEYKEKEPNSVATAKHARNFLDCIKSRKTPNCSIEEGHRSTTFAHLANISLATGDRLQWDADKQKIIGNEQANQMLHYEYRKGYELPDKDEL